MSNESVTFTGTIVQISYENGKPKNYSGCEDCQCQLHDDPPYSKGQYITVRLDDEKTRVWLGPIEAVAVAR